VLGTPENAEPCEDERDDRQVEGGGDEAARSRQQIICPELCLRDMRGHLQPEYDDHHTKHLPALLILKRIDRDRIQPLLPSLQVDGVPLCMDGPDQLDGPDKGQHDGEGGVDDHPGLPPHTL